MLGSRKIAVVAVGQRGREGGGKRTLLFDLKADLDEDLARDGGNPQIADPQRLQNEGDFDGYSLISTVSRA